MEKNICLSCGGYFNPEEIVETVCIYCLAYERMTKSLGEDFNEADDKGSQPILFLQSRRINPF